MRNCVAKRPRRLLNSTCWWNGWGRVEMADVSLFIGGRQYVLTCRDGDEVRLEFLAAMIDAKVQDAKRSEEHTSELPSLLRIPYAVLCLDNNNTQLQYYTC